MDTLKLCTNLKELGHVPNRREELREFCKLNFTEIIKILPRQILNSDGSDIVDCLLNGVSEQSNSLKHKVKIVNIVISVMRKESTSLAHCSDLISRLCLELPRLPLEDLVRWADDSVQSIVANSDINMIWRDVLPECLNALSSYDKLKHCGTEMSTLEYKEQCVKTLCQCQWTERQLVQLAAMFHDMRLSRNDHKQVVNKLCSYVLDVPPETLPVLFHQMLKLCKTYDLDLVLSYLSHYFNVRLYSKLDPPPQDSESTTMDIDDITSYSNAELSSCLSTCLYHISQGAADPETVRKQLKTWPKTQLLRNPFLVDILLVLSEKGTDFRTACLDVIKSAIDQRLQDELISKESAWVRSVLPPDVDVPSLLKVLTTESAAHRQLTTMGLINLGFLLLNARQKTAASKCTFGELILVRLAKNQPETAPHILSKLADRLAGDLADQQQYADCLYVLCKMTPLSVERCSQLSTILENCQPSTSDYRAAATVLESVHPLLSFSTKIRDTLVMVCRKGLYSRDSNHRCLSVCGFLTVLRHAQLSRSSVLSCSNSEQYSARSYLTQLTLDLHATQQGTCVTSRARNEAVCMEVASILRRCLLQDAAVKQLLYTKIFDCVKEKEVLHETILEMLYEHLTKYLPEDEAIEQKLNFDKCVQTNAITGTLTEPIGYLLFAIAQFLQPIECEELEDILGSQSGETGSAYLKSKLQIMLDKICESESLANVDLEDLTDLSPESKAKYLKVQQILHCYEALIAYQVMQWSSSSQNTANTVYKLYKGYYDLLEKSKMPSKGSKKGSKLNDTKDTIKSQKSQKSQKDKTKGPVKLSNLTKERSGPFKPLPCLWDLPFCLRAIELLYSDEISWSSSEQRNNIRARRDFHHFVLRCVQSVVADGHFEKRDIANYVVKIAAVLYERCFKRFRYMCDFDEQTSLECLDLLKDCLNLLMVPRFGFKPEVFLPNITGTTENGACASVAAILEEVHTILTRLEQESEETEGSSLLFRRTVTTLASIVSSLSVCSQQYAPVARAIVQLEDFVRTSKQDCLVLIPILLAANCRENQDAQFLDDLIVKVTHALGRIDEEESTAPEENSILSSIDEVRGQTVLTFVCTHIIYRIKHIDRLIARGRDLQNALNITTTYKMAMLEKELSELDKSVITQLCQTSTWSGLSCKVRCTAAAGERMLSAAVRLYAALTALVRHLDTARLQHLRLDRLLKICGKKYSAITDNLITYVEASQPQQQTASKVLRDTRLIPRLVLEAETFHKHVLATAKKAKLNLEQYLSLGTARDFRIKAPMLQQVLNAQEQPDQTIEEEININEAETEVPSMGDSDIGTAKRRRVS